MTLELVSEIWSELRRYVNTTDRDDAAECMVSVLIDNNIDADEIKSAFKTDSEVRRALTTYLQNHDDDEDEEDYADDTDDDDY